LKTNSPQQSHDISLQSIIDGFTDAVFICEFDSQVVLCNLAATKLLREKADRSVFKGTRLTDLLDIDKQRFLSLLALTRSQTGTIPARFEIIGNGHQPEPISYKVSCSAVRSASTHLPVHVLLRLSEFESKLDFRFRDLQARMLQTQQALKAQRALATQDPLTGLSNRRHFLALAEQALLAKKRSTVHLSLIMVDIDFFKQVNDSYGHATGDVVLQLVSKKIQENCRENDLVCRWGGEEFIVLSSDAIHDDATILAERLRTEIENTIFIHGQQTLRLTVSIGVANAAEDENCEKLIARADDALYLAKTSGRNRAIFA
jgi:diguanylate cyclase (GGDEF)-like protein